MTYKNQELTPLLLFAGLFVSLSLAGTELRVDFSQVRGTIRPLHGVNMGPLCYRGTVDLSDYHRELGVPLTRLHDVVWVNYDAVDISTVFREFRNDPTQPDSYTFGPTDDYLASIVNVGSSMVYRLGESIEHTPRKHRVHPPKDPAKWAEICCGIIRHYNEGWAEGFRHDIRYWEIWNEPENQPAMWTGTDGQYFELYEVTARAIKARWPDLKVGGPSLGNTGEFTDGVFKASSFLLSFLKHCQTRQVPLDFFSWHRYSQDPSDYGRRARALRELLDAHGFSRTESHCNEWNYLPREDWRPMLREGQGLMREQWSAELGGPRGAAFAAWVLMSIQDAPVNAANFYTGEIQAFGLFNLNGVPRKTYYAFKAFRRLLDTPRRVETPSCEPGQVAVCAGLNSDNTEGAVLLSNFDTAGAPTHLILRKTPWSFPTCYRLYLLDGEHDLQLVRQGILEKDGRLSLAELRSPSVLLLQLKSQNQAAGSSNSRFTRSAGFAQMRGI
ncbi:MAG TPA: hypothetical protein P5186_20135 [Candidatus Paceibacterota bacterium]|nr:hypothetical protein [Verrucomicrobiota bacterium]HRY50368.1 hypothetical protein [Candidatus Paceibacterota bacterium]HSA00981.1 hypothetical protein [Candidatus Paceibacterota bacterium]